MGDESEMLGTVGGFRGSVTLVGEERVGRTRREEEGARREEGGRRRERREKEGGGKESWWTD